MGRLKLRIFILIAVGAIILIGAVFCIFVQDQTTIIMLAILTALYIAYLMKVIPILKEQKNAAGKPQSPLPRHRK